MSVKTTHTQHGEHTMNFTSDQKDLLANMGEYRRIDALRALQSSVKLERDCIPAAPCGIPAQVRLRDENGDGPVVVELLDRNGRPARWLDAKVERDGFDLDTHAADVLDMLRADYD